MKDDNRMEFAAIPIVVVILGVLFAVMIFAEFGVWGWVVFGVISAAAVVIVAVILARRPTHASELDAPTTSTRRAAEPDGTYKVVLVCDDSCTSPAFVDEVVEHAAGRRLEVFVVAPELGSRLALDRGRRGPRSGERAPRATLRALETAGVALAVRPAPTTRSAPRTTRCGSFRRTRSCSPLTPKPTPTGSSRTFSRWRGRGTTCP